MIQRVQTLYWLFSIVMLCTFYFFPIAEYIHQNTTLALNLYQLKDTEGNTIQKVGYHFPLLLSFLIILNIVNILFFKKRKWQIRLSSFSLLLHIIFLLYVFYYIDHLPQMLSLTDNLTIRYQWSFVFILISMIMQLTAIRAVRRDEHLIRSSEHIL